LELLNKCDIRRYWQYWAH